MQADQNKSKNFIHSSKLSYLSVSKIYNVIIGVHDAERIKEQMVKVEIEAKFTTFLSIDTIKEKIDFLTNETIQHNKPFLLERMAFLLSEKMIKSLPFITLLTITIKKPAALKLAENSYVTITISNKLSLNMY